MILQQLRYLREIVNQHFNISRAADALNTSQPGVSKQVRLLEDELKTVIFQRERGRIVGLTEPGQAILKAAETALNATDNIRAVASDFLNDEVGAMRVAATFSVAKYILPPVFVNFVTCYPRVRLTLLEGDPASVCRLVAAGEADIAVGTRSTQPFPDLLMMECCTLPPVLIAPRGHPLLEERAPTLAQIARYRFITYNAGSLGQSRIQQKFEDAGYPIEAVFSSAMNADVVKSLVEAGLGIAVLSKNAYDPLRDTKLGALDLDYLLEPRMACFSIRSDLYPRAYLLAFINMLVPGVDRRAIEERLVPDPRLHLAFEARNTLTR